MQISLKVCSETCRISEMDVFPKRSTDAVYAVIFSILLHRMFVALLMSKPSKNFVSLSILLSCNSKGLIFDFYLNRKRNKCWLAAYSCDSQLFTRQYIGRDASSVIHITLPRLCYKYCGIKRLGCQ